MSSDAGRSGGSKRRLGRCRAPRRPVGPDRRAPLREPARARRSPSAGESRAAPDVAGHGPRPSPRSWPRGPRGRGSVRDPRRARRPTAPRADVTAPRGPRSPPCPLVPLQQGEQRQSERDEHGEERRAEQDALASRREHAARADVLALEQGRLRLPVREPRPRPPFRLVEVAPAEEVAPLAVCVSHSRARPRSRVWAPTHSRSVSSATTRSSSDRRSRPGRGRTSSSERSGRRARSSRPRPPQHGHEPLVLLDRVVQLLGANLGAERVRRDDEEEVVGRLDAVEDLRATPRSGGCPRSRSRRPCPRDEPVVSRARTRGRRASTR